MKDNNTQSQFFHYQSISLSYHIFIFHFLLSCFLFFSCIITKTEAGPTKQLSGYWVTTPVLGSSYSADSPRSVAFPITVTGSVWTITSIKLLVANNTRATQYNLVIYDRDHFKDPVNPPISIVSATLTSTQYCEPYCKNITLTVDQFNPLRIYSGTFWFALFGPDSTKHINWYRSLDPTLAFKWYNGQDWYDISPGFPIYEFHGTETVTTSPSPSITPSRSVSPSHSVSSSSSPSKSKSATPTPSIPVHTLTGRDEVN